MVNVVTSGTAALSALILLCACGSVSSPWSADEEDFNKRLADAEKERWDANANLPPDPDVEIPTEVETRGGLENAVITLADGSKFLVDGVFAGESKTGIGYVLAGELDDAGNLAEVILNEADGEPYVATDATGSFRYSGDMLAYLGEAGKNLSRVEGSSGLTLNFDDGTGRIEGVARGEISGGGKAEAELSGDIGKFSGQTGLFEGGTVDLSYVRSGEAIRDSAELSGQLFGENDGFAATFDPSGKTIEGSGVLFGTRDK